MKWTVMIVALLLAGCAAEEQEALSPPAASTGTLSVYMTLPDGPVFIEGSTPVVRIERPDGSLVLEEERPVEALDRPILEKELPHGRYVLDVVQRPCEANCGNLDPPDEATRCRTHVVVRPAERTRANIELRHGKVVCS